MDHNKIEKRQSLNGQDYSRQEVNHNMRLMKLNNRVMELLLVLNRQTMLEAFSADDSAVCR